MLVSNSDQHTGLPEVSLGFRRSLQVHSGMLPRPGHVRFLPNAFHCVIHQTSHHRRCVSKKKQDRQCTCNVPLLRVRVTVVTTENHYCVSFVLLTHICQCQQYNKYGMLRYGNATVHSIVELYMSRPTTWNKPGAFCKVPDTLSDFIQIWISRQIFIKVINTKVQGS